MRKGDQRPFLYDEILARSKDILQLFDQQPVTVTTPIYSDPVECGAFRLFLLHLDVDSAGSPTTLQFEVQFLDRPGEKWHTWKQGLFAALFYEDEDTASGVQECFTGEVGGRSFRLKMTGVGTSAQAYFTVNAAVEFRN